MSGSLRPAIKAYDIRGEVPTELDAAAYEALGVAFAQVIVLPEQIPGVVVGRDMRESSPELAAAFAEGVASQGVDVTAIGLAATDQLYYASGSLHLAGAMVTASHNPARDNGLKLCRPRAVPVGQDSGLAEVGDLAHWILQRGAEHGWGGQAARRGEVRSAEILADYAAYLHSLVDVRPQRPLRIVVDAGNGMAGHTAQAVLGHERLSASLEVVPLWWELDGNFPHHVPNPLVPENLRDLQAAVRENGADLGLAFDGDADRCVVVDERGEVVSPGVITAMVADREIAREVAAGKDPATITVVHNTITSQAVTEVVAAAGARAVRCRVGHTNVKACMAEHDAVFGGEHSAHYYFRDFWRADSGMLAALHVLALASQRPEPLSQLAHAYSGLHESGEINLVVADPSAALERVRAWGHQQGAVVGEPDGVLVQQADDPGPGWWVSVRCSNTEALVRINVESADPSLTQRLTESVMQEVQTDG